jgi:hypothetical protein
MGTEYISCGQKLFSRRIFRSNFGYVVDVITGVSPLNVDKLRVVNAELPR